MELVYNADAKQSDEVRAQLQRLDVAQVELRVAHLEKALGVGANALPGLAPSALASATGILPPSYSSSSSSSSLGSSGQQLGLAFPDLTTAVVQLQRKLDLLDNSKLDWIFRRTKLLALELEALEQQRNRLAAASATCASASASAGSAAAAGKTVSQQEEQVHVVTFVVFWLLVVGLSVCVLVCPSVGLCIGLRLCVASSSYHLSLMCFPSSSSSSSSCSSFSPSSSSSSSSFSSSSSYYYYSSSSYSSSSSREQQVNVVYEQMGRWDKVAQQLPVVIARLQSLRDLHEYQASLAQRVAALQQRQENIQQVR
jgi:hypothetical protein